MLGINCCRRKNFKKTCMHTTTYILSCMLMTLHLTILSITVKHAQLVGDTKIKRSRDHPYNKVTQGFIYLLWSGSSVILTLTQVNDDMHAWSLNGHVWRSTQASLPDHPNDSIPHVQWLTLQRWPRGFRNDFDKFSHGLKNYSYVYVQISIRKPLKKKSR